jgi:hypothetical protein
MGDEDFADETIVEVYTVKIKRNRKTGVAWQEEWFDANGKTHRVNAPALIQRALDSGEPLTEGWYEHGRGPLTPGTNFFQTFGFAGPDGQQSFPNLLTEPQPPLAKTLKLLYSRAEKSVPKP